MRKESVIFNDAHPLSIDEKCRLLIPSDYRQMLVKLASQAEGSAVDKPDTLIVKVGQNGRIWIYPQTTYQTICEQEHGKLTPNDDQLDYEMIHFAMTKSLTIDSSGRVIVPQAMLKETGTEREVFLLGMKNHLQVWNRLDWEAKQADLRKKSGEINRRHNDAESRVPG